MKNLILTALNDDSALYYDNFIPFCLSLKQTDYQDEVGVIDYGMSELKKDSLHRQGIKIFPASNRVTELLLDRHLSAADIAKKYNYDNVAVYDADIWFPNPHLSLFKTIENSTALFAAQDVWFCSFISACMKEQNKEEIINKINILSKKNSGVWQCGLIVGNKDAWQHYQDFVLQSLTTGKFKLEYGIDSTLLNLYSFETNQVQKLPMKYNCLPVAAVEIKGDKRFLIQNELVEGFHISRNHRDEKLVNYRFLYPQQYYTQGRDYALSGNQDYELTKESLLVFPPESHHLTLELLCAFANGGYFFTKIEESGEMFKVDSLWLEVSGFSQITLRNPHQHNVRLLYGYQSIVGYAPCSEVKICFAHSDFHPQMGSVYFVDLAPNESLSFCTRELDRDGKRIRWFFDNLRLI
ncbi:hypothetical protein [Haemophilus aegyptius]|uniref:hypothetical protein n=1 Tax=Haemophilus aegyptius TaxID=197575 RepID=UPI000A818066|nr:hypothetical protein [Haemophilus aegyptius]STO61879.1 Uncharacterised protein [Haemophilus aegyptius]